MLAPKGQTPDAPRDWMSRARTAWTGIAKMLGELAPKGLYARALIIIIAPIVLLESVVAFAFMERHWNQVTRRLSEATARDMAAVVDLYQAGAYADENRLADLAQTRFGLSMTVMAPGKLPPTQPKPFFDLLDRALSEEISTHVKRPFWIDTVGNLRHVEIRVNLDNAILRFTAPRALTYASNSHIFLMWMVGTSVVLLTVAILFLRNQIRPILRLAEAADEFGKGRPIPQDFRPRGAREVRQAAQAFLEMRDRIKHHVEQRTTMLAGVSHDLRTVLTRFKLELALLGSTPEVEALRSDVNEMQHMLEDYLAFAKGDGGEAAAPTNVGDLLEEVNEDDDTLRHADRDQDAPPQPRSRAAAEAAGVQARGDQSRDQCRPLRRLRRDPGRRGQGMAAHRGRRRRTGHSAGRARQRLPAVLPAGQRPQPGHGQHRPRAGDRPRHRPQPRRRHCAGRVVHGRPARDGARAAVAPFSTAGRHSGRVVPA